MPNYVHLGSGALRTVKTAEDLMLVHLKGSKACSEPGPRSGSGDEIRLLSAYANPYIDAVIRRRGRAVFGSAGTLLVLVCPRCFAL